MNIILVHGAFADASGWNGVIEILQAQGHGVIAPANPLRGIKSDSAYIASVIGQINGPVLLVGHSYGGAVISNAAAYAKNVVGLVFVSGFAPDEGEKLIEVENGSKDSILSAALVELQYPIDSGDEIAVEFVISPALFHDTFAADLPKVQASIMAATQRPVAASAFSEANGKPAWKQLPSWAVVARGDKAAGSDVILSMAERAKAKITELEGSHVIMMSKPQEVAKVILEAASGVASQTTVT